MFDIFLIENIKNFKRYQLKKIIENWQVKLNSSILTTPSTKIRDKDEIVINLIEQKVEHLKPKKIELDIIYEDKDLLVINKPKGMVVHPGAGNYENTLVNALIYKYKNGLSDINGSLRPGIVHRIDKHTSGLLVIAKNNLTHSSLVINL